MQNTYRIYISGITRASDADLNGLALGVIDALTGHLVFTTPPVPVAKLTDLQQDFSDNMTASRSGGTDRIRLKHAAKKALQDALVQDALYCQGLSQHNLDQLLSSGYDVCSTNRSRGPLDAPSILAVLNGVSGQLVIRGLGVVNAHAYQPQMSTDGGKTWTDLDEVTGVRRIAVTNLTPGTVYAFRLRAVGGTTHYSDWSAPVSHMAT